MRRSFLLAFLATALVCALPTYAESFRNPVRIATKVNPSDVSVVDLNGDGRPDILWTALGSLLTDQIIVHTFLAQVSGGFAEGPVLTLPTHVTPYCRTGDVTGDGKADLVCTYANAFDAALLTFPGNGDGSFGSPLHCRDYDREVRLLIGWRISLKRNRCWASSPLYTWIPSRQVDSI